MLLTQASGRVDLAWKHFSTCLPVLDGDAKDGPKVHGYGISEYSADLDPWSQALWNNLFIHPSVIYGRQVSRWNLGSLQFSQKYSSKANHHILALISVSGSWKSCFEVPRLWNFINWFACYLLIWFTVHKISQNGSKWPCFRWTRWITDSFHFTPL